MTKPPGMPDPNSTTPPASPVILLPSERFFVRAVPLAADAPAGPQVELALENVAPFPLAQLYYGYLAAPAGDRALVFAAYRKRFTAGETAAWTEAAAVLPGFLVLLGDAPKTPWLRLWTEPGRLTAVAWNGRDALPVAVMARETDAASAEATRSALLAEIRERSGVTGTPVQEFGDAATTARSVAKGTVSLALKNLALTLGATETARADVRDKEFLALRQQSQKRDLRLWLAFQLCAGGLAAALVFEAGLFAAGLKVQRVQGLVQQQSAEVRKIETAQALTTKIDEMTRSRLKPFEMIALANQNRPASIQFVRATTTGSFSLEVEAQTSSAPDVGQFEAVLRATPEFAGVEVRDLRSREGVTSFTLTITFKPESLQKEGGA
ncbi:MAG: hypothetical protein HY302_04680 [Opitutae bacterium]|nr:hypothetical protein [Opitutae bacterium]